MSAILNFTHQLNTEVCYKCGIHFAMPSDFKASRRRDKECFFCPNGHSQAYVESEADRLRKQLAEKEKEIERQKQARQWADDAKDRAWKEAARQKKRANGYKGIAVKIKKRVGNGVCPCCKRTFQNLMMHMKTKHPKFKETP